MGYFLDEWLSTLIQYSYLPESGKSFTLLTQSLAETLVDQSDELFMAKLEVIFLSRTEVQNINAHFGKGNELYLSGMFKHLKGYNFKYHTLLEFKTWDCFDNSKDKLKIFKKSYTGSYAVGWVMFTSRPADYLYCGLRLLWLAGYKTKDTVPPRDNVSEQTCKIGNDGDLKPSAKVTTLKEPGEKNNLNESGNTAKMVGAKSSVVKDIELAPKDWRHTKAQYQSLNYSLDVTVPKSPLKVGRGFALHDIEVMLKESDPEILYPFYQIMAPESEQEDCLINRISDLVQCYGQKHGNSGKAQPKNKGNLLRHEYSNSSSDSNSMPDNEKGLKYDLDNDGNTEVQEEDKQYS
eukprot:jgi/Psemu1/16978/gm1.16978_g